MSKCKYLWRAYITTGHPSKYGNVGLWLKYKRFYGNQQFYINLIKFIQCKGNLPNKDS